VNTTYRIVVGVDGSEGGARALRWAAHEAEARGGTVQAVNVWNWEGPAMTVPVTTQPEEVRQYTERTLAAAVQAVSVEHPAVAIAAETVEGKAATSLVRIAAGADLLVLGSHGHGRLHHALLGSVTEECVRAATCPVVVIPRKTDAAAGDPAVAVPVS
jgi:nucleotide-binding universal stress UspA family protein